MSLYIFNKAGEPISVEEWARLSGNYKYKTIQTSIVGSYVVSTVWLGLDHGFGYNNKPIIFESMTFTLDAWNGNGLLEDHDCDRYSTEEEAKAGHQLMVKRAMKLMPFHIRWWIKLNRGRDK